jgi:hypothetical protein
LRYFFAVKSFKALNRKERKGIRQGREENKLHHYLSTIHFIRDIADCE